MKTYAAGRVYIGDHHAYTCLAWDSGFEFLFPTGIVRWSTVHNNLINRFSLTSNTSAIFRLKPKYFKIKYYLNKGVVPSKSRISGIFWYADKESALQIEVKELDLQRKKYEWVQWDAN